MTVSCPRVGLNLLPWMLGPAGFAALSLETLPTVLGEIRTAGFSAVMADIPGGMPVGDYADLLAAADLAPAPPERPPTTRTPMSRSRFSPGGGPLPPRRPTG